MYKISGCKVYKMKTVHVEWDMMLIYERQFNVMPYYSIVVQHNCTFHYITTNTSRGKITITSPCPGTRTIRHLAHIPYLCPSVPGSSGLTPQLSVSKFYGNFVIVYRNGTPAVRMGLRKPSGEVRLSPSALVEVRWGIRTTV